MRSLKICHVTPELAPYAKVGGLGDVAAALPATLHRHGHQVAVLLPFYGRFRDSGLEIRPEPKLRGVPLRLGSETTSFDLHQARTPAGLGLLLVRCDDLYGDDIYDDETAPWRAVVLCRAAIETCQHLGWAPDVFHLHDWPAAMLPLLLRTRYGWDRLFEKTRTVLTLHNLAHQGMMTLETWKRLGLQETLPQLPREDVRKGVVNLLRLGIEFADALTTVSPTYAREIQSAAQGMGLDAILRQRSNDLFGILNGIDEEDWNPQKDTRIPFRFSAKSLWRKRKNKEALLKAAGLAHDEDVALFGTVTRLTSQKGIDLIEQTLPDALRDNDFQYIVLGSGETRYEEFFHRLQSSFPAKVCYYRGFNNDLAHLVEAGSDFFLMPSYFEPCGLNQMYSLAYGTIPVVRRTGGLADTVQTYDSNTRKGNGIVFQHYDSAGLRWAIDYALSLYRNEKELKNARLNAMAEKHGWEHQAVEYERLYENLVGSAPLSKAEG